MNKVLACLALAFIAASMMMPLAYAIVTERVEWSTTYDGTGYYIYGNLWDAQTFTIGTVGPNKNHVPNYVKLYLRASGSPTGLLYCDIKNVDGDGKPTGDALVSTSIDVTTLPVFPTPIAWIVFTFPSNNIVLNANTKYALVAHLDGGDADNYAIWWRKSTDNPYSGGLELHSSNGGSSWTPQPTADFMFDLYGDLYSTGYIIRDAAINAAPFISIIEIIIMFGLCATKDARNIMHGATLMVETFLIFVLILIASELPQLN